MRSVMEIGANVPAFLVKLWKLVDDPETDHLISWSYGGKMFSIQNQADFSRELLPLYYKHNNMASFIRQLNMYGFHKVTSVENGGLKSDKDEIEFSHPCFSRGHPYLLEHIKRKIAIPKQTVANTSDDKVVVKPELMTKVLTDVKQMKGRQESLDARFSVMKHENGALWREVALLRQKHIKQQQIVNNLIQFLMSLVQPSRNGPLKTGVKRRYQLMINDAAHNNADKIIGDSKNPRLETDEDAETEETDLNSEVNGPIILEIAEQMQAAKRNSLLNKNLQQTGDPKTSNEPSSSSPAFYDSYDVTDDIDNPPTPNIPECHNLDQNLLTAESPLRIEPILSVESMEADDHLHGLEERLTKNLTDDTFASENDENKKGNSPAYSVISSTQVNRSHEYGVISMRSQMVAPVTLPPNIFDSDEANSQEESAISLSEVNQQAALSALQSVEAFNDSPALDQDEYLNSLASGSYNQNLNISSKSSSSKEKSKAKKGKMKDAEQLSMENIKEEILNPEDDDDPAWSNMTLATVPSTEKTRPVLNRFQSVTVKEYPSRLSSGNKIKNLAGPHYVKEEVDDHLDSMQTDLESLRELLRSDNYSFDAGTILGLFGQDDPFYSLSMNPSEMSVENTKETTEDSTGKVISYIPPIPLLDFDDFTLDDEETGDWQQTSQGQNATATAATSDDLNTPQVQMPEPDFPLDGTQ